MDPATQPADTLQNIVLSPWALLLMIAVWSVLQAVRGAAPPAMFVQGSWGGRLLPLAPVIACSVAVWIPGPWLPGDVVWAQRVVLGIVLGTMTAHMHTILSRFGLHDALGLEPDDDKRVFFVPEPLPVPVRAEAAISVMNVKVGELPTTSSESTRG